MVEHPLFQAALQAIGLIALAALGLIARRYFKTTSAVDRLRGILEGEKNQPDARQLLETISLETQTSSRNSASAVQLGVQLQGQVGAVRTDLSQLDGRLQGQMSALDKRVSNEVGELRGRVDGHEIALQVVQSNITDLQRADSVRGDQLARIETVVQKRSGDELFHEAATGHLKGKD